MQLQISEVKDLISKGLKLRGLSSDESSFITDHILEAELMGKKTHGIGKLFLMEEAFKNKIGEPKVIKDKGNYALIDGNKAHGLISAEFATKILLDKASKFDNAIVATTNSYYYTMAGIFAKQIAKSGFLAIVLNNGGPATISPYGGNSPIFGTNPIAIAVPTETDPLVLDMTTGEKTWGEIQLAKVEKRNLQEKTFLDKEGEFTTDPYKADAIVPFGGYKGYGLNFMFEIMTGAFVAAKMGLQSKDGYDLGFLFMAMSPEMFTTREKFNDQVKQLIKEVKESRKLPGVSEIFLPGEKSLRNYKTAMESNKIDVSEEVFENLKQFSTGVNIKEKSGLKE